MMLSNSIQRKYVFTILGKLVLIRLLEGQVPNRHEKIIPPGNDRVGRMCALHSLKIKDDVGNIRGRDVNVEGSCFTNCKVVPPCEEPGFRDTTGQLYPRCT